MGLLTFLACLVLSWKFINTYRQKNKKGPINWPIVGAGLEQWVNFDRMHDWLVEYLAQSPTVVVPAMTTTYTYIAHPTNVEHVLKTNFDNYPKGEVYHSYMEVLLGDGIFNVDGELWRKQRKTASFEFASKNLRDFNTVVFRDYSLKLFNILNQASFKNEHVDMQINKHDILSRFIELGKDPENNITDKSLRDIVLNFVIAGRDTTATTLSWAIYMIMTHEHVAEKLYAELKSLEQVRAKEENVSLHQYDAEDPESVDSRAIQFAGLLNYDSLSKLYYLHAVITETLRLYPAVPQDPKGILEDDVLPDGTKLKAGGMVTYVPYSMGRMEYNWGSDAASFNPERWLKDGVFQNASPFKFTAFQGGPRICLGKDSAYLQMKMALAILCRFYKFKLVPGHLVKYRMMTILSMEHGLKLTVSPRS
ncbi:cytochrome P450 704B1 isoform X2 [Solanum verrucosum]|uniref:cytochrome P450 704B1 isoform X2 n=1 Tax=Solanum verrucosum TaxID=315347 RepID=UPI0020D123F7|nr:cytochrome P450 704B1 isoform X2 [Solanum verrucosum]